MISSAAKTIGPGEEKTRMFSLRHPKKDRRIFLRGRKLRWGGRGVRYRV